MLGSIVHSFLLLVGLPSVYGAAINHPARNMSTTYAVTSNYVAVVKRDKPSRSKRNPAPYASLTPTVADQQFLTSIQWGGSSYTVVIDTGSSDTWLINSGFQCFDTAGHSHPPADCTFGPPFNGILSGGAITDQHFNIDYESGEFVEGIMGYEDVTIAGITVSKQEVALGTSTTWKGDGISSGVIGLAYEPLTRAFQGTDPANTDQRVPYSPIIQTMIAQNLLPSSIFSVALERRTGGYIAFGGLPPTISPYSNFVNVPIEYVPSYSSTQLSVYAVTAYLYYISFDPVLRVQYIIDTGSRAIWAPTSDAQAINNVFVPPATYNGDNGYYYVDCTATVPSLSVDIGDTAFSINPVDLINQNIKDQNGLCLSGIQDGGQGPYLLGSVFLENVVVVFDIGNSYMSFSSHEFY